MLIPPYMHLQTPDVADFDLDGSEEYMVIACDGLWDVMGAG